MRLRIDPVLEPLSDSEAWALQQMETNADWGNVSRRLRQEHRRKRQEWPPEEPREHDDVADQAITDASPERFFADCEFRSLWQTVVWGIVQRSEWFGRHFDAVRAEQERRDHVERSSQRGALRRRMRLGQLAVVIAAATVGASALWKRRQMRRRDDPNSTAGDKLRRAALLAGEAVGFLEAK